MLTRMRTLLADEIHPVVFGVSAALILGFVGFTVVATDTAASIFEPTTEFITETFGWFMILAVTTFLAFCVWLVLGRYARVRLGPDGSTPDYSNLSWFAMLFSAGMGIGLLYWGVAEPVYYYVLDPPIAQAGSQAAAEDAMRFSFHHWGFSPWAIYAVIGLGLAYFGYRHDQPLAVRSLFRPLLGDRVDGPVGNLIDILAVFGTMFGVATSLGLGVMQINGGLNFIFDVPVNTGVQLGLIAVITLAATVSVVAGLDRGIQRLSQVNITLAAIALAFVALAGPTLFLLSALVDNTGAYLGSMIETMFWSGAYDGEGWLGTWTLFYWAWWASWSPFVGMFIARISRGRTIREFILGVLLVPSLASFAWFTVLGNSALVLEDAGAGLGDLVEEDEALALFGLLEQLPASTVTAVFATLLVASFFVTSSDSGSFVIDMLTSGGSLDPAVETRVFWAVTEGLVAAALLLAGGLGALQAGAIATGLPFMIVLLFGMWALALALRREFREQRPRQPLPPVHLGDVARREREQQERRELERRDRELDLRERELDLRERELDAGEHDDRRR